LRIKENKEVYEGEVTELTPEYTEGQVCYGKNSCSTVVSAVASTLVAAAADADATPPALAFG